VKDVSESPKNKNLKKIFSRTILSPNIKT